MIQDSAFWLPDVAHLMCSIMSVSWSSILEWPSINDWRLISLLMTSLIQRLHFSRLATDFGKRTNLTSHSKKNAFVCITTRRDPMWDLNFVGALPFFKQPWHQYGMIMSKWRQILIFNFKILKYTVKSCAKTHLLSN